MKKYILMFGLTLIMGLFITNTVDAQWTSGGGYTYTTNQVGIGTSSSLGINDMLSIIRTSTAQPPTASQYAIFNAGAGAGLNFYKARGTLATPTAAAGGDFMGGLIGFLHDGSSFQPRAAIRFQAAGASNIGQIVFQTHDGLAGALTTKTRMIIDKDGKVGIGTTNPQSLLAVKGKITSEEVEVTLSGWSDFVFQDDFSLMPLNELESFISSNRHLPDVPTEAEVMETGVNLGEMSAILLQKIEEMTLYIIDLNKRIAELEGR